MALSTGQLSFQLLLAVLEKDTAVGAGDRTRSFEHRIDIRDTWQNGTGANKQDTIWSDRRSISSNNTMDLRGGVVSVVDGSALNFPLVTGILVRHLGGAGAGNLTIGQGSNPFNTWVSATGDSVILTPGGVFLLTAPINGYICTASTGDILQIAPSAGTIDFDIAISGRQS